MVNINAAMQLSYRYVRTGMTTAMMLVASGTVLGPDIHAVSDSMYAWTKYYSIQQHYLLSVLLVLSSIALAYMTAGRAVPSCRSSLRHGCLQRASL